MSFRKTEDLTMPQVFKIGSYWVYFWANENKPLEPVHVHISKGKPTANATKFWITKTALASRFRQSMRFTLYVLTELFIIIETILRFSGNLTLESFKCL